MRSPNGFRRTNALPLDLKQPFWETKDRRASKQCCARGCKPLHNAWQARLHQDQGRQNMAQPLLPQARLRTRFDLYLNDTERAYIQAQARAACLPISTFIRKSAMAQRVQAPPSEVSVRAWGDMARVGSNLNQLAHAVAAGRVQGIEPEFIAQVAEQVRQLRLELIGSNKERGKAN